MQSLYPLGVVRRRIKNLSIVFATTKYDIRCKAVLYKEVAIQEYFIKKVLLIACNVLIQIKPINIIFLN